MSINSQISRKYAKQFEDLLLLQEKIKHLDVLLEQHYPIAIVEAGKINVFDYDSSLSRYELKVSAPNTTGVEQGVQAAFPLDVYDNKLCVVVSGDIFDTVEEQVILFHEFVHCYQYNTCEMELRTELELARNAVNEENYYWELQYPFPYHDSDVAASISKLISALTERDLHHVFEIRKELVSYLSKEQYEYLVWQEWKEGFARYIENMIKVYLGIAPNHGGSSRPYSRTTFYETGSQMIDLFMRHFSTDDRDLRTIFRVLRGNSLNP